MKRHRAFSLIEVSVAMAIAGLISAAAVSAFATLNRQLISVASSTRAADESKTLVSHFVLRFQEVGGGSLRPWDAVIVEPAPAVARGPVPATTSSSRIWYATALTGAVDCTILSVSPSTVTTHEVCCLGNYFAMEGADGTLCPQLLAPDALLVNGDSRHQRTITRARIDHIAHTCLLTTSAGPMAFGDRGTMASLTGGVLTPTRIRAAALDEVTKTLSDHVDANVDGTMEAAEALVLADRVHAFNIRLGWDEDGDGEVKASEWTDGRAPPGGDRTSLREIELGVIVGADMHDARAGNTVTLAGRSLTVPGQRLEATSSRALFRNLFLFLN